MDGRKGDGTPGEDRGDGRGRRAGAGRLGGNYLPLVNNMKAYGGTYREGRQTDRIVQR